MGGARVSNTPPWALNMSFNISGQSKTVKMKKIYGGK